MVDESEADPSLHSSHLFTLRLWPENMGSGQTDWRGKIQPQSLHESGR